MGLLIMYLFIHKKNVYLPAKEQANVGPTAPAGPVYEEVSPKEEIELNNNQAYGPCSRTVKLLLMFINVLHTHDYYINVHVNNASGRSLSTT